MKNRATLLSAFCNYRPIACMETGEIWQRLLPMSKRAARRFLSRRYRDTCEFLDCTVVHFKAL